MILFILCSSKPHDLLILHPKSANEEKNPSDDHLLKAFCGLFGVEMSHSTVEEVVNLTSENPSITGSHVLSPPESMVPLPPFCRKDYHSTYGTDYPQHRLNLAFWFESVFSQEAEEETKEGC